MAITRRIEKSTVSKKPVMPTGYPHGAKTATSGGVLTLPTSPSVPSDNLGDYSWLVYGTKKIGKSSLAGEFPDALFFMFEPGGKALSIYQVSCNKWADALQYVTLLEAAKKAGTLQYKTIVLDTGFEAFQKCFEYVCDAENIEYPRMDNFGKDWKKISNEFRSFHNRLAALDLGLIVLCHEKMKESQTRTGNKFDMVVPNLSSAADDYYRATIDNVVWYHYRNRERYLLIKGSDYALAGTAIQANKKFLTKAGDPVFSIPMGKSAHEGYQYILRAFNNEQTASYKEDTEKFIESAMNTSVHEKIRKKGK